MTRKTQNEALSSSKMFVAACEMTCQNTEDHSHVTHLSCLRMYTLKDLEDINCAVCLIMFMLVIL